MNKSRYSVNNEIICNVFLTKYTKTFRNNPLPRIFLAHAYNTQTEIYELGVSPAGPGLAFNRGWRALTTMLMFGRKSASYCTHKAATAAIYNQDKHTDSSVYLYILYYTCSYCQTLNSPSPTYLHKLRKIITHTT